MEEVHGHARHAAYKNRETRRLKERRRKEERLSNDLLLLWTKDAKRRSSQAASIASRWRKCAEVRESITARPLAGGAYYNALSETATTETK